VASIEIVPSAPALLGSLRGVGYAPETALADIIDNSISAGAGTVDLTLTWNNGDPRILIVDDGEGMDRAALIEAMRFGGAGPAAERREGDLGRFGLGLKTATLSQCRRLTVLSVRDASISCLSWDLDHIERNGLWEAQGCDPRRAGLKSDELMRLGHGTAVEWSKFDAASGFDTCDEPAFLGNIEIIDRHLGMVFHRFISGDARRVAITINGRAVRGWDPFLEAHEATIQTPEQRLNAPGGQVRIRGFVLPHRDRFKNAEEFEAAGGPGGWNAQQGFYVYRGKRLVVPGGWLGLGGSRAWTREESSRLARIRVDIGPPGDRHWRIDVRKSSARLPAQLRKSLQRIAEDVRRQAREVFAWRGAQGTVRSSASPERIWEARETRSGRRYAVRRDHPLTNAVRRALGGQGDLLDALLSSIEWSVPVERIWLDVSEAGGAAESVPEAADVTPLVRAVVELTKSLPSDLMPSVRIERALRLIPPAAGRIIRPAVERLLSGEHQS